MYELYSKTRLIAGPFEICRYNEDQPDEPAIWILPGGEQCSYNAVKQFCVANGWPEPVKKTVKVRYWQDNDREL